MVDYSRLKASTQAYRLSFNLLTPRNWALADVNSDGSDGSGPPADPIVELGPVVGYQVQPEVIHAFDGIRDMTISGTIDSGFSIPLMIPEIPATFTDYFGVQLMLATWHGNLLGVSGGFGTDPDSIPLCQGYMRRGKFNSKYGSRSASFEVRSSISFWQDSSFSRGIDWGTGLPHGAPVSPEDIINHLVYFHTNTTPRSIIGIYLPYHNLGSTYSLNKGSVYSMVKQVADNACLIGWVYADREDNIQVTGHPNMVGSVYHEFDTPQIDYSDDIVLEWDITEQPDRQCAQCTVVVTKSDNTEERVDFYSSEGLGDRPTFSIRSDDVGVAADLAARYVAHANRRFPEVKVQVPINVVADLGDIVTCTTAPPYNNRGVTWDQKKFVVVGLEYSIETQDQRFSSWVTLDEVVASV